MTWLSVLQFANYLIPLLIIPYIVRILGAEIFGKITYAQNIISYFTLLVNFGFDYSATREIAINKGDANIITQIFWSVLKQKIILLVISFGLLILLYFYSHKVSNDFTLYLIIFLMNVGIVLFPTWFFQGVEKMGKMAVFNVLIKGLGLILTVFFVKTSTDYLLYPLLNSIVYVILGTGALFYIIKHYHIKFTKPNKAIGIQLFRKSTPIFLNNLFVSGYTVANLTILGMYYSNYEIGIYGGAQKIIMAILMISSMPINLSIFPKLSREFEQSKTKGLRLLKKALIWASIFSVALSLLTYLTSNQLVNVLLGSEFEDSKHILKLFSTLPFLVIIASILTVQGLYGMRLQRYAPFIGVFIGITSIILNLIFIPKYGIFAAAINWIFSQTLEIILASSVLIIYSNKIKHES